MRVLLVAPFLPYPSSSGGRIRIFHLLRGLARRHEVTLLTAVNNDDELDHVSAVEAYCRDVVTVMITETPRPMRSHVANLLSATPYYRAVMSSMEFQAEFGALMARQRFDVVQVELLHAAHMAAHLRGVRKVLDMHNVESVLYRRLVKHLRPGLRRMLTWSDAVKLPAYQRRLIPEFDHCLAVSDPDAAELRRVVPGARITVIPNGVDPEEFFPQETVAEPNSLVFTASFTYPPNTEAMVYFCRDVLPRIRAAIPEARLSIVGQRPGPEVEALGRLPGVEVTGRVPDVRPYLARAAVVVVPLRVGSGTRLKILEAMAMGRPVVSTSLGAEGLDVRPGHDLEIADGAAPFAAATVALLHDPDRRARLGIHARRTAMERYAWSVVADRLDQLYRTMESESASVSTLRDRQGDRPRDGTN